MNNIQLLDNIKNLHLRLGFAREKMNSGRYTVDRFHKTVGMTGYNAYSNINVKNNQVVYSLTKTMYKRNGDNMYHPLVSNLVLHESGRYIEENYKLLLKELTKIL